MMSAPSWCSSGSTLPHPPPLMAAKAHRLGLGRLRRLRTPRDDVAHQGAQQIRHARARQMIEMVGRYEQCRLARVFPDNVRAHVD